MHLTTPLHTHTHTHTHILANKGRIKRGFPKSARFQCDGNRPSDNIDGPRSVWGLQCVCVCVLRSSISSSLSHSLSLLGVNLRGLRTHSGRRAQRPASSISVTNLLLNLGNEGMNFFFVSITKPKADSFLATLFYYYDPSWNPIHSKPFFNNQHRMTVRPSIFVGPSESWWTPSLKIWLNQRFLGISRFGLSRTSHK